MSKTNKDNLSERTVSAPTRRRLPMYYRTLINMYASGRQRVSSDELSAVLGIAPSQVRGDLCAIGCYGQSGYGYQITKLYRSIGDFLKIHDLYRAIMIGDTPIAKAIAECNLISHRGVKLAGRFDEHFMPIDDTFNAVNIEDKPIFSDTEAELSDIEIIKRLSEFCRISNIDIMILACSARIAERCADIAKELGVIGILNFSDTELKCEGITVRNLHIEDALMMLCLEISENSNKKQT